MSRLSIIQHRNPLKNPVDSALTVVRYNNEFSSAVNRSDLFNRRKDSQRKILLSSQKISLSNMNSHGIISFAEISEWLKSGNVGQLECLLLKGKWHLLEERDEFKDKADSYGDLIHPDAKEFIDGMQEYKRKVDLLLEAICMGDERTVAETVTYRKCILARHPQTLASTVHLAVIHNHPNVLQILIDCPLTPLHSRDAEGRCPLHYAAAIAGTFIGSDSKCYDMLVDRKANENALDYEGYTPKYFFRAPKLVDIRQVRGLNQYPTMNGDEVDQMIGERNVAGLKKLILSGRYEAANIQERIFLQTALTWLYLWIILICEYKPSTNP
uniref:ANK_REP_REGION domain-containing protein n=1 Tax=Ditylenchus dipsaci TaxID=166011 RepID=A0A915EKH1_9BILA